MRKICICSLSIGEEYKRITKYGRQTKVLYAQKHGYDFRDDEDVYDRTRHPAWSKILLILRYLRYYDYIVWVDADTLIMNDEIKMSDLIEKHMIHESLDTEHKESKETYSDIMVAQDWKMINTGVIFIKNTEWAYAFFTLLYDSPGAFERNPNYEQNTFIEFYDNDVAGCREHIKVLGLDEQNDINAYYFTFYFGHFLIHFCGCKIHQLEWPMTRYCPIKRDEDTDESFQQRLHWLQFSMRQEVDSVLGKQEKE
jgi:hypothetical protein